MSELPSDLVGGDWDVEDLQTPCEEEEEHYRLNEQSNLHIYTDQTGLSDEYLSYINILFSSLGWTFVDHHR